MHRSGPLANEAVELVGYIRVDLDTPTPVLREFIRRYCGGWLNEHAKVREKEKREKSCGVEATEGDHFPAKWRGRAWHNFIEPKCMGRVRWLSDEVMVAKHLRRL